MSAADIERVKALREAYWRGASMYDGASHETHSGPNGCGRCQELKRYAAAAYPMPDVPREYASPSGLKYRVVGGRLFYYNVAERRWVRSVNSAAEHYRAIVDLFDRPTEPAAE